MNGVLITWREEEDKGRIGGRGREREREEEEESADLSFLYLLSYRLDK